MAGPTAESDAPRWLCVCGAMHDGPPRSVGAGLLMHEPVASVTPPVAGHEHVWVEGEVTSGPTMVGERLTVCAVCGTTQTAGLPLRERS